MIRHSPSLGGRLFAIALLTTLVALACALLLNVAANAWAAHQLDLRNLEAQAQLVGRMTAPALAFEDDALARENLALFEADPRIRVAALYDAAGAPVASYLAQTRPGVVPPAPGLEGARLAGGRVHVFRPIVARTSDAVLGTVYLQAESGVAGALLRGGAAALAAAVLAMLAAWLLVRRLLPIITVPIAEMSGVARRVVQERDYSRRVEKLDDDEVGGLVDAFNAMLAEVEARTEQLRDSLDDLRREAEERRSAQVEVQLLNERLEQRVASRTRELERSNQALMLAKSAADEASQAKSTFLATMSHEIRTPMNGVVGMIDVLHQSSLREDQVEMVDLIRESAMSLLGIIDDILDFSRIEAGRMEVEDAPVDIGRIVEGACAMLSHIAMRKGVELCMFVDPRVPSPLLGDSLRLRQVLVNLVGNAIKFSSGQARAGRVSVRATLASAPGERPRVSIGVEDNGVGMDARTHAQLFTAFSQADTSTTRRFGGSGLGLAISHRLVGMMGGSLTARGEPGKGAMFTVTLPLAEPDAEVHWDAPPALPSIAHLPCLLVGESSLVPDLREYLDAAGCAIHQAADLRGALAHVAAHAPVRPMVIVDAHGLAPRAGIGPELASLLDASGGVIAIRHQVSRRWAQPDPRYVEIDCAVLTRRTLVCGIAGLASGQPPAEANAPAPRRDHPPSQSREDALRQGRLVLVAEDNEFNQQVILRQLRLLGYAADVAPDGREAFERWRAIPYGLVLTDLHMPGLDGYELAARIREHPSPRRTVPILALTANAVQGEADRCRAAGMNGYLTKPILLDQLDAELGRWLSAAGAPSQATAEDADPPILPGVLESFVGDDPEAARSFLARFQAAAEDTSARIAAAWARDDIDTVAIQAHSLKSAARMAGATAIAGCCADAETRAREGDRQALGVAVVALRRAVERLHAHMLDRQ